VSAVTPPLVPLRGGARIYIYGTELHRCSGLFIGGVAVTGWTPYNATLALATTAAVPRNVTGGVYNSSTGVYYGGASLADGTGAAVVQLLCRVSTLPVYGMCGTAMPCIVFSSATLVSYNDATPDAGTSPVAAADAGAFMETAGGQAAVVTSAILLLAALAVVARRSPCARPDDDADGRLQLPDGDPAEAAQSLLQTRHSQHPAATINTTGARAPLSFVYALPVALKPRVDAAAVAASPVTAAASDLGADYYDTVAAYHPPKPPMPRTPSSSDSVSSRHTVEAGDAGRGGTEMTAFAKFH
jgi:hypothetical protein